MSKLLPVPFYLTFVRAFLYIEYIFLDAWKYSILKISAYENFVKEVLKQ